MNHHRAPTHRCYCPRSLATPLAHSGASPQWPSQKRRRTRWSHTMRAIRSPPQLAKLTCIASNGSGCRASRVSAADHDGCGGQGLCYRWGRAYWCQHLRYRALTHAWGLRGGNRHRALTRACALRYISVASGNRCLESSSCLGFRGLRLHCHRHNRRRPGCVVLTGTNRLRGDFHHVGRRRIDAVRGIGTRDQDRRDGTQAPDQNRRDGS